MATSPAGSAKSQTIQKIVRARNDALDKLHADMDRVSGRLDALSDKATLTDADTAEQKALNAALDELVAVETHVVLFSVSALDSSSQVKFLLAQVDMANKELAETQKNVEAVSQTIKQAGDFIKGLTGVLNSLSGLLAVLV